MHRGPFFMGHIGGMTVNIVTAAWLVFAIVFFSFPYYMPVTGESASLFLFLLSAMDVVLILTTTSVQHELYLRVRGRIRHPRASVVVHRWQEVLADHAEGETGGAECSSCYDGGWRKVSW